MTASSARTSASDPRDRVIWALRRAELAVQNMKDRLLRPVGITASHYALLVSIASEPGLGGAALARRLNISPQAVAALVARLADRGLVERRAHPRHPHVQELHLTDVGSTVLQEAEAVMDRVEDHVVEILGQGENDDLRVKLERLAGSSPTELDGTATSP